MSDLFLSTSLSPDIQHSVIESVHLRTSLQGHGSAGSPVAALEMGKCGLGGGPGTLKIRNGNMGFKTVANDPRTIRASGDKMITMTVPIVAAHT